MPILQDQIGTHVRALFVGINPGLRSAAVGHHFAGPTNRFWRLLFESGLVPEPITFADDERLPAWGYGLTNIIARPTRGASELTREEYEHGARVLLQKIGVWRPAVIAPVGVSVWRALARAVSVPGVDGRGGALVPPVEERPVPLGLQEPRIDGARVYVLPNPSGRNAHVSYAEMLRAYSGLRQLLDGGE
jgi:TDG/mug DNA glycosylase family protein